MNFRRFKLLSTRKAQKKPMKPTGLFKNYPRGFSNPAQFNQKYPQILSLPSTMQKRRYKSAKIVTRKAARSTLNVKLAKLQ